MQSWKKKWMYTGGGGLGLFLLSFYEGQQVAKKNDEQKKIIQSIEADPLMDQAEYDANQSKIKSLEAEAKQAKLLADLFFLGSAGLIGTAVYFYLNPPTDSAAVSNIQFTPFPRTGEKGMAMIITRKW